MNERSSFPLPNLINLPFVPLQPIETTFESRWLHKMPKHPHTHIYIYIYMAS